MRFRVEGKYPLKNGPGYEKCCDPPEKGKELPDPYLKEVDFAKAVAFERRMLKLYKNMTKNVEIEGREFDRIKEKKSLIAKRLGLKPSQPPPLAAQMVFLRQKINEMRAEIKFALTTISECSKGISQAKSFTAYALYKMQNGMDYTEMESYSVVYKGVHRMFLKSIKKRQQPQLDEEEKDRISHRGRAGMRIKAVLDNLEASP